MPALASARNPPLRRSDSLPPRLRARAAGARELELAAGLARGEPAVLREIQHDYAGLLSGYLNQLLRDEAAAEDVLQQVMLEVWQRGSRFDPERGSIVSWLLTLARSRAIDQLRRQLPEPSDPHLTAAIIDGRTIQRDRAEELAEQWRVAHLLKQLPHQEAELLRMRFQLDMSQSEIAVATGIPLGTVKMRMVSALERLRVLIEEEG